MSEGKNIERLAQQVGELITNDLADIIAVEGQNHFEESFDNEGFTDSGLEKWKERKVTDNRGRDKRIYRSNRIGRRGDLTKFGRQHEGRPILTGHNTGGNKLRYSITSRAEGSQVVFTSDKEYAEVHNEGSAVMPKRQFMGESEALHKKIVESFEQELDKIFGA